MAQKWHTEDDSPFSVNLFTLSFTNTLNRCKTDKVTAQIPQCNFALRINKQSDMYWLSVLQSEEL